MTTNIELRPLTKADLPAASKIHALSFESSWGRKALAEYLAPDGITMGQFAGGDLQGFILLGPCTDQTDIYTIAVAPDLRGKGIGRQLVGAAETEALSRNVELIFLEVAEDNDDAITLYKSCGYVSIGKRKNYYKRKGGRVNALTMRKDLEAPKP